MVCGKLSEQNIVFQKDLVKKDDWDIIVLLDAVRYDYFEIMYKNYFKRGKLQKVISSTTSSPPWYFECFEKGNVRDDIIFIAPDFELSSMDTKFISIGYQLKYGREPYNMNDFFGKVVDIWKTDYDEKLGVLHPDSTTDSIITQSKKNQNHKIIGTYYQVHDPYIYYINKGEAPVMNMEKLVNGKPEYSRYHFRRLKDISRYFISDESLWRLENLIGKPPKAGLGWMWLNHGKEGILKGYYEDLKLTLNSAKRVVDELPYRKIIITTDHGELLGEHKRYGHGGRKRKELIEIPWLEICPE